MIQYKEILHSKPVILLILVLTTTAKGFLQDETKTTRLSENIREDRSSIDRQLENSQNLPIRNLDVNRQFNEKDKIVERLYDRRSFRTGTLERSSETRRVRDIRQVRERSTETNEISRDVRTDVRDVNNNQRVVRNLPHYRQNTETDRRITARNNIREDHRQLRDNRNDRKTVQDRNVNARYFTINAENRHSKMEDSRQNTRENRALQYEERRERDQRLNGRRTTERSSTERDAERFVSKETSNARVRLSESVSKRRFVRSVDGQESRSNRRLTVRSVDDQDRQSQEQSQNQQPQRRFDARVVSRQGHRVAEIRPLRSNRLISLRINHRQNREATDKHAVSQLSDRRAESRNFRNNVRISERLNTIAREDQIRMKSVEPRKERQSSERYNVERISGDERYSERRERYTSDNPERNSRERRVLTQEHRLAPSASQRRITRSVEERERTSGQNRNVDRNRSTERTSSERESQRDITRSMENRERTSGQNRNVVRNRSTERASSERKSERDITRSMENRERTSGQNRNIVRNRSTERASSERESERDITRSMENRERTSGQNRNVVRNRSTERASSERESQRDITRSMENRERTSGQNRNVVRNRSTERASSERESERDITRSMENRERTSGQNRNVVRNRSTERASSKRESQRDITRSMENRERTSGQNRNIVRNRSTERASSERESERDISRSMENRERTSGQNRNIVRNRSTERASSERESSRNTLDRRYVDQSRERDSRELLVIRRSTVRFVANRDQRRSVDQRSLERRDRLFDSRATAFGVTNTRRVAYTSQATRSDSTRKIRSYDGTRDLSERRMEGNRLTQDRRDDRQRDRSFKNENHRQIAATDRYDPLTSNSRKYFERLVSQRAATNERNSAAARLVADAESKIDESCMWINVAKTLLAAFLVAQILANSSKVKKYGFYNTFMNTMNTVKEKVQ